MIPFIHIDRPWLRGVIKASSQKHSLYLHGIKSLEKDLKEFLESGKHTAEPFSKDYRPNPFFFQYDLELHIFLNWDKLKNREISRLKRKIDKEFNQKDQDRLELVRRFGPSGIPRHEHLFNAAEIRWPTTEHPNGSLSGSFVRDDWSIRRMRAISDKNPYTIAFGGGGQGKTWTLLGFGLMVWEHYIYTWSGAKASFSSVNKDKINNVAWPELQKLHMSTSSDISLYAGKSIISGDWTLRRPGKGKKDTGGVFKGILVGRHLNDAVVTDKLTGTHGFEAYFYLIDEAQSTPKAPIEASTNYMMTGVPTWVALAGNYDEDGDTLGQNAKPINGGWESVDPSTGEWESEMITGGRATVLHFNNSLSPGYLDKEAAKRFPYLPNKKKQDAIYPKGKCTLDNKVARRFWFGWRSTDVDERKVLTHQSVVDGSAHLPLDLSPDYPIHNFGSLDIAESGGDRNPFGHFADGHERDTENVVWGLVSLTSIEAPMDVRRNQDVITDESIKISKRSGIDSGCIIMDGTKNTGHSGRFHAKGYEVISLIYHKALPDGKREDKYTRRKELPILVNPNVPMEAGRYAHQILTNHISLGAWLLKEYVAHGKVRGINDSILSKLDDNRTLEEEMFRRSFIDKVDATYGDRETLDSKEEFVDVYKFSPDILDIWFQAAYYAFVIRGIPIYDEVDDNPRERREESIREEEDSDVVKAHSEIWEDEDLLQLSENY